MRTGLKTIAHQARTAAVNHVLDATDMVLRRRDPMMPPRRLIFVGGDERIFWQVGQRWVETFIQEAGLLPGERVLDAGCGVGRMAVPLAAYLGPDGSYEGFDIVESGIRWCQKQITPRHPNFRFTHADLKNPRYNKGTVDASRYRFPYPNADFDFAFLTSVFTHMMARDVEHYAQELSRVLRPGGRCLATFFVLSPASLERMETGIAAGTLNPDRHFLHHVGVGRAVHPDQPEGAIAYPRQWIEDRFADAGLTLYRVLEGGWSGLEGARHAQDAMLFAKN